MMLTETLQNEVARIDRDLRALSRKRFAALARSDNVTARDAAEKSRDLLWRRRELTSGQPNLPRCD